MASSHDRKRIHPVILSGGVGTRLWPLSRALYPKQLLPLVSDRTLLQETVLRVSDSDLFAPPLVVCNDEHRFIVAEQLRGIGANPTAVVLEPEGRNTAPAAAIAAMLLAQHDPDALMLLLPSDHVIEDRDGFLEAVSTAAVAARHGAMVTFGIAATRPETGYGHIRQGAAMKDAPGCFKVERFVEKPKHADAVAMVEEGGWSWNSGMFLFGARAYLDELSAHRPEMVQACRGALEAGREDLDFLRLDRERFASVPSDSIDYAVMEHTDKAAVVPADIRWNDIGAWPALWDIAAKDNDGNVTIGPALTRSTSNSYLRTEGATIAAVGVSDLVIVATEDAVLVASKEQAQDVKHIVEQLRASGSQQHLSHVRVYRPWGSYQSIDVGARFQVKQLVVNPGAKLSLQSHNHRAEHWVVVSGTARVTRDDEVRDLGVDESTYIPIGTRHRLENPGSEPLRVIEVQSGDYLGEDDIVRYDDVYGRSKAERA